MNIGIYCSRFIVSVFILTALDLSNFSFAQSAIRACSENSEVWHECIGRRTRSDGYAYTGQWKDNLPNGHGELFLPNGDKRVGIFENGNSAGLAIQYYPDGQKHVGFYKDGKEDGEFILYHANGETNTVNIVKNGELLEPETNQLREELKEAMGAAKLSDFETALSIWAPIADRGNAEAQYNLAIMNEHGEGMPADEAAAYQWMKKAADQYHPFAQYYLGVYYQNEIGVKSDDKEAFKYIKLAAESGVIIAQREIAYLFRDGKGVEKNLNESVYWFSLAALNRDLLASLELGNIYKEGAIVSKDLLRSYQWYRIATGYLGSDTPNVIFADRYASPIAEKELKKIEKQLNSKMLAKANEMIDNCLKEKSLAQAFEACGLPHSN